MLNSTFRSSFYQSNFFLFLFFFSISVLSYAAALSNGFLGDDVSRIYQNYALWGNLDQAISSQLNDRPVLMFFQWLDVVIFGMNPFEMRVVSLCFHAMIGVLFVRIAKKLLAQPLTFSQERVLILFALIFICHPLHNQVINIVIQRGVLLSTFFMLLSFSLYIDYLNNTKRLAFLFSILFYLLSINAKGITVVYPLLLICYQYCSFKSFKKIVTIIPFFFVAMLPAIYYAVFRVNTQEDALGAWDYFLVQTRVIFVYLKLFIVPFGLKYLYHFESSSNPFFYFSWLAILGHLCLLFLLFKIYKKNTLTFLMFLSVYIFLIPESSFFSIRHVAFEHRTYLPMFFLLVGLFLWSRHWVEKKQVLQFGLVIVLLLYGALNWHRNTQINPPYKWVTHTILSGSTDMMYNIVWGADLIAIKRYDEARSVFGKLSSDYPEVKEYVLFKKAAQLHFASTEEKKVLLQEIVAILRSNSIIVDKARIRLNMIVISETRKLVEDDFRFYYLIEKLVTPQLDRIKMDIGSYFKILQVYSFALTFLDKFYGEHVKKLTREDRNHQFQVKKLLFDNFNITK